MKRRNYYRDYDRPQHPCAFSERALILGIFCYLFYYIWQGLKWLYKKVFKK